MPENRALVIGISEYPKSMGRLPAVASDVREIAKLLGSEHGEFDAMNVEVVTDAEATRDKILSSFRRVFAETEEDATVFAYVAGHGAGDSGTGEFYFIPHDVNLADLASTAVPLVDLRDAFLQAPSRRAFLWLDFCHSGGIVPRDFGDAITKEADLIERTLKVVRGEGKLIVAACTSDQKAYESSVLNHGLFTAALLEGLNGAASSEGEVTASSLFDFVDRRMGSARQRPMQFGHMTGRLVLMKFPTSSAPIAKSVPALTGAINSSGKLILIGSSIFESRSVTENADGTISIQFSTTTPDEEAAVRRLKSGRDHTSDPVPFAFGNLGIVSRVRTIESKSANDGLDWTVTLVPENIEYGGGVLEITYCAGSKTYTPEDFARLRAGRLLLNDPPPLRGSFRGASFVEQANEVMMESHIAGSDGAPAKVDHCALHMLRSRFPDDSETYLKASRLLAVYVIRASGIAEEILELSLGPIVKDRVRVRFRGRRRQRFTNVPPAIIEIDGDCALNE